MDKSLVHNDMREMGFPRAALLDILGSGSTWIVYTQLGLSENVFDKG